MNKMLNRLFNLFTFSWICHWIESGRNKIDIHETLDELYNDLKSYIDEYAETELSDKSQFKDIFPIKIEFDDLPEDCLDELVLEMRSFRDNLNSGNYGILDDWKGRLITTLNHYIFMLGVKDSAFKLFSNKNSQILAELRKLFSDQAEFLSVFNAYLKGKKTSDKIDKFFKDNESTLIDLHEAIYNTNQELFDIRSFVDTQSDAVKKSYNKLVNFFDVFCL